MACAATSVHALSCAVPCAEESSSSGDGRRSACPVHRNSLRIDRADALRRVRRAEPGGQRVGESDVGSVSYPGDVAVRANQHGGGAVDHAEYRELPLPAVARVDQLNSVTPRSDVKAAGLTEVEQHWPRVVQQLEGAERSVGGHEIQVGHATSEQRMSLAEVVVNVQP